MYCRSFPSRTAGTFVTRVHCMRRCRVAPPRRNGGVHFWSRNKDRVEDTLRLLLPCALWSRVSPFASSRLAHLFLQNGKEQRVITRALFSLIILFNTELYPLFLCIEPKLIEMLNLSYPLVRIFVAIPLYSCSVYGCSLSPRPRPSPLNSVEFFLCPSCMM